MMIEAFEKALQAGKKVGLHQVIIGPGITAPANEYAQSLFERGLVKKQEPIRCSGHEFDTEFTPETETRFTQLIEQARNGVLIIDAPQAASKNIATLLKVAIISASAPVVIITGDTQDIEPFIAEIKKDYAMTKIFLNINNPVCISAPQEKGPKPAQPRP